MPYVKPVQTNNFVQLPLDLPPSYMARQEELSKYGLRQTSLSTLVRGQTEPQQNIPNDKEADDATRL